MVKTIKILEVTPYKITCEFNTHEVKTNNMFHLINNSNEFVNKQLLLDPVFFEQVQIGQFGELFWKNAAYFRNEAGDLVPCEYDVSPEFVYSCYIHEIFMLRYATLRLSPSLQCAL
jgi:hypothetical protein